MICDGNDYACSADSILSNLLAGFSKDADYWTGHNYFDADTPFHSYFIHKLVGPPPPLLRSARYLHHMIQPRDLHPVFVLHLSVKVS